MSNYRFASWPEHNGKKVVLEDNTGLVIYRNGTSTTNLRLKVYTDAQVSNASGAITFSVPAGYFTQINSAIVEVVRNTVDPSAASFAMLRSVTQTAISAQIFEGNVITTLLLGQGNGLRLPTTAIPCFLTAFGVGP